MQKILLNHILDFTMRSFTRVPGGEQSNGHLFSFFPTFCNVSTLAVRLCLEYRSELKDTWWTNTFCFELIIITFHRVGLMIYHIWVRKNDMISSHQTKQRHLSLASFAQVSQSDRVFIRGTRYRCSLNVKVFTFLDFVPLKKWTKRGKEL